MASDIPRWAMDEVEAMDLNISVAFATSPKPRAERMRKSIIARALLEAEERGAERMKAELQADFVGWLRPWVKKHFGRWITYNTAKGAFNDFAAHQSAIRNLETKDAG